MAPKKHPVTVWDGAADIPRAGVPDAVTLAKQNKRWRRAVAWWPVLAPIVIAVGVVSADGTATPEPVEAIATTTGRAAAQDAVQRWLDSEPEPLPGGRLLSWDGATPVDVPPPTNPNDADAAYAMEINTFTLVTGSGQMYAAGVQVATSERLGSYVVGGPSLTPLMPSAPQSGWGQVQLWPGLSKVSAPEPVVDAVTAWASAFTGQDSAQLRLVTGDTNTDHFYMPLVGVESAQAKVVDAAALTPAQQGLPTTIVARTTLLVTWAGTTDADKDVPGTAPETATLTYDLLIDRADTGAPAVLAWGAPGSGPTLTAFSNAVTGRTLDPSQATTPTTSAKPSPSATATTGD